MKAAGLQLFFDDYGTNYSDASRAAGGEGVGRHMKSERNFTTRVHFLGRQRATKIEISRRFIKDSNHSPPSPITAVHRGYSEFALGGFVLGGITNMLLYNDLANSLRINFVI
ncbi:hypothetical protein OUZ56_031468 [Daphnia magna]|uniref:Uncharacterized protein n=1 Tax=Daphnia magna TaxID=35525 RepID=A0ABQ9ZUB5_9CRUS|nr:hypothetical protein OUZ56_031468 [Daphnia magna]